MGIVAVLIDTCSIQKYVFSSNRLKVNIGASNIVENIFKEPLKKALKKVLHAEDIDIDKWKHDNTLPLSTGKKWSIGYIGGGNALLFFREKPEATQFVGEYSEILLEQAPGLKTAYAIEDFDMSEFSENLEKLHKQLNENRSIYPVRDEVLSQGITAEDSIAGGLGEFMNEDTVISAATMAKLLAVSDSQYKLLLNDCGNYEFPKLIDDMGQSEGNSYIGVIHIDGNSMGKRLKNKELSELRQFSIEVEKIITKTMNEVTKEIVELIDKKDLKWLSLKDGKLPFRPIIIAGDDITLVAEGTLAVYIAEEILKRLSDSKRVLPDGKPLYACAGIMIVKSKYPFYRAYKYAEALCGEAKKTARKTEGSYLSFLSSSSGLHDSLEDIRNTEFSNGLSEESYRVDKPELSNGFGKFKELIKELDSKPKNKVFKLRELLSESASSLPDFGFGYSDNPKKYFQAIELLDFYPTSLIKEGEK